MYIKVVSQNEGTPIWTPTIILIIAGASNMVEMARPAGPQRGQDPIAKDP